MLPDEERDDLVLLVEVEDEDDVELEVDLHRVRRVADGPRQHVAAALLLQDHVHQVELVIVDVTGWNRQTMMTSLGGTRHCRRNWMEQTDIDDITGWNSSLST